MTPLATHQEACLKSVWVASSVKWQNFKQIPLEVKSVVCTLWHNLFLYGETYILYSLLNFIATCYHRVGRQVEVGGSGVTAAARHHMLSNDSPKQQRSDALQAV